MAESAEQPYHYFSRFTPVEMVGYTFYIYEISLEDANRVRSEIGPPLKPLEESPPQLKSNGTESTK